MKQKKLKIDECPNINQRLQSEAHTLRLNNKIKTDEENVFKDEDLPTPLQMSFTEFELFYDYVKRNKYGFVNGDMGNAIEEILTPRTTEFFKLLPDLIMILVLEKRNDIIDSIKPILNSLIALQDLQPINYDIIAFFQDIDFTEKEYVRKLINNSYDNF